MLSAHQLCRFVDGETIVDTVDFEVEPGDVFVIFGPSGAGKSSLLRLLNRLDEPSSGTVRVRDQDYRDIPPQRLRKQVGMVPQQPTLIDGTVAENVTWGPRLRGEPVDRERVNNLLDRLGLSGFADRQAGDLSGGEAQRVAIARTLYNEPDVVLLDEPASSLDADAARQVETLLSDVMRDLSITAILVTHDTERARRLGSRGIRMEDGRVTRRGSIDDILDT
ncbi:MAG: ATP-binding cassette domain-containing protein [Bacteroidetes bacterium]|jgi:putative ABC transport system ATP-binding protein|nr:ATP-binding cassette domain-containing protein [Bacteroidota bacterium]